MLLLRLAAKNLLRNRRRTALTVVSVVAGVGVLILGQGLVSGLDENIIVAAIDGTVGHVMARPAGYPIEGNQHPLDTLLRITPEARALLERRSLAVGADRRAEHRRRLRRRLRSARRDDRAARGGQRAQKASASAAVGAR